MSEQLPGGCDELESSTTKAGRTGCGCPRVRLTFLGVAVLAFGLLLWARFLLVTGHPRTAIADPPAERGVPAATAETAAVHP